MNSRAEVSEPPTARCRVCLQTGERVHLARKNLSLFYSVCRTATIRSDDGEESWVCQYCWARASQCIKLIECARVSEQILGNTSTGTHYTQDTIFYDYSTFALGQTNICNYDSCQNSETATSNHDYIKTEHRDCEETTPEEQEPFEVIDKKEDVELERRHKTDPEPLRVESDPVVRPRELKMERNAEFNNTYLLNIEPKERGNVLETIIETDCSDTNLPISNFIPKGQKDKVNHSKTNNKNMKKKIANKTNSDMTSKRKLVRISNEKYRCAGHFQKQTHTPPKESEDLYCVECDRYFRSRSTLESHLRATLKHVSRDTFRHVCDECPGRFAERNQLELHVRTVHRKLRTHPCTQCDKAYFTSGALRTHGKRRHGAGERARDHICTICRKGFLKRQTLRQHLQAVHWKQRPYACGVCAATFGFQAALYTHNKLKHARAHT